MKNRLNTIVAYNIHVINDTVSLGSHPQNLPHAASAHNAPKTTPKPKIGSAQIAARYAIASKVLALGKGLAIAPKKPFSCPTGCHDRSTYINDANPEIKPIPPPMDTVDTWNGNQKDCSAGTTGPDWAYNFVPP